MHTIEEALAAYRKRLGDYLRRSDELKSAYGFDHLVYPEDDYRYLLQENHTLTACEVHTCSAAKVDLKDYLLFVFTNRAAIDQDPSEFTPYAYALRLDAEAKAAAQKSVVF